MNPEWWWTLVAAMVLGGMLLGSWPSWKRRRNERRMEWASHLFHLRREWLEADFLTAMKQKAQPRGLSWGDCEFEDGVFLDTNRQDGQLRAFVAVSIGFQAIEGGGMEDNPNVANLRAATAVFLFDGKKWCTDGRTMFNLSPQEAAERFQCETHHMRKRRARV